MRQELAFALKCSNQILDKVGRTRSNRVSSADGDVISEGRAKKRRNVSVSNEIQAETQCLSNGGNGLFQKSNDYEVVRECLGNTMATEGNGEVGSSSVKKPQRRFTRSALKSNVDGGVISVMETQDLITQNDGNPDFEMGKDVAEGGSPYNVERTLSKTPKRKLEMKMSKQIALAKIPLTVRELFETGLLEGYQIYYAGPGKGYGLRGTISGTSILCACDSCRGCKAFLLAQFEIHACGHYRRAAQYVCLENGNNLRQILQTCKTTRLNTLEETIQNAIGPLPGRDFVACQKCKESFCTTSAANSDQLCSSCKESNLPTISPVRTTCQSSRSFESVSPQKLSHDASARVSPEDRSHINRLKKSPKSLSTRKSPRFSEVQKSLLTKINQKKTAKSPKTAVSSKYSRNRIGGKSPHTRASGTIKKRPVNPSSTQKLTKSPPAQKSYDRTSGKITKKDINLHKLVFEEDGLPDGTELAYYARGKRLLDGYKKGFGIFCRCCNSVVSASLFEAHAGCASRRKPYLYIYTSNGVSLHELSLSLLQGRTLSAKFNDDLCTICADGGNLLLCDGCPRAFHRECASLSSVPRGKWFCKYCQNMFEREKFVAHNANAFAAGRVSGVDPIEQISKRCIRIVKSLEAELSACVLCRGSDFAKSGFGPRTVILCDQCEKEYHVGCLKDHKMADLEELPKGKWFCSQDCRGIRSDLQNLLDRGAEKLPDSSVNIIRKKHLEKGSGGDADFDISWRLLSGKVASPETRPLLSQAVAIFHECFSPIIDVASGRDLIPAMVYGRNARGQEYGGMYCAVLTVNSVVVSAGIFRVFGPEVAELPLVATSSDNHGKGYFQALFARIEGLLESLKVRSVMLPAAEEAEAIWTERFGFTKMAPDQLKEYKNWCPMVRFEGTSMLHKLVPRLHITRNSN